MKYDIQHSIPTIFVAVVKTIKKNVHNSRENSRDEIECLWRMLSEVRPITKWLLSYSINSTYHEAKGIEEKEIFIHILIDEF